MERTRRLVLMPRGHTMVHFPHSMQLDIILKASFSLPLWRHSSTFLMLIPEKAAAGQVALHDPQAMQRTASGSTRQSSSKRALSTLSIFMVELGEILKPKMFSIISCLCVNVSPGRLTLPLPESPAQSSDPCMHLHRRFRFSVTM